jgi:deazaflavin-dependent oxidoreductase (nitroreductase family)
VNPIMVFRVRHLHAGGRGVNLLRVLRVRGRKSGRVYEVPVRVAVLGQERYVMAMLGNTQWARNLRAAGKAQLVLGQTVEDVGVREIHGEEKLTFLRWCTQQRQFVGAARSSLKATFGERVDHFDQSALDLLSRAWSVFSVL